MIKLNFGKKKKLFSKRKRRKVSRLFLLRLRFLRFWSRRPIYRSLFAFRRPERYFLKRNTWTYRKFLRKIGKKIFYFFIKKVGVYKHVYFLNKYFRRYRRSWDLKLAKKLYKRRMIKSKLSPRIKYIKVSKFVFKNSQYFDKNNIKKRLSFFNLVKALAHRKTLSLLIEYRRQKKRYLGNSVFLSLQKNNVRHFVKRSELSGYRVLKYLVLFSKYGNRRRLFNSFISSCLSSRFDLFRGLNVSDSFGVNGSGVVTPLAFNAPLLYDKRFFLNLSLFCRRILFNQFFFYKKKVNKKVSVKVLKQFNSNFFLLSNRLLNHFLSLFRIFVEIRPWKKSGRSISVPVPIKSNARRSFKFAHWFKESVLASNGFNFGVKAFAEFQSVSRLEGDSIKKLNHLSKSIQSNRALIRKSKLSIV